ncbi:MAG: hypothetical protein EBS01_04095 [Verrucomicrobia bacterium]|nr:hypothetical protein [Verrucomicrobiota bacterium]
MALVSVQQLSHATYTDRRASYQHREVSKALFPHLENKDTSQRQQIISHSRSGYQSAQLQVMA